MNGSVRVLFFASAREAAGCAENSLPLEDSEMNGEDFWRKLTEIHPALGPLRNTMRLAKNHEYMAWDEPIQAGDEVALIPPVSGG